MKETSKTTNTGKVSVIIPAYNVAGYISETIDSVIAQSYKNFEIVVINDGSPDSEELEKVLGKYEGMIIYLKQENKGSGPARNYGIRESKGELIAFLDGDDIWNPDFLSSSIEFMEEHGYDMVYSDALLFGDSFMAGQTYMGGCPSRGEVTFDSLLDYTCCVILSGVLCKKEVILKAGMFEEAKTKAQDFDLWLRMAYHGAKIGYQTKVLLKYRIRRDSISGSMIERSEREIDAYERIRKKLKLSEAQEQFLERKYTEIRAEIELHKSKGYLLNKDYKNARLSLQNANKEKKSAKLSGIIFLLRIAPPLVYLFYKSMRSEEIPYTTRDL